MCPGSPGNSIADRGAVNTILSSNLFEQETIPCHAAHGYNDIFGERRAPMVLSFWWMRSASQYHIGSILFGGASAEVIWITAWRIVAGMKNVLAVWYRAIGQFIRNTMRTQRGHFASYATISVAELMGLPVPALIGSRDIDLAPEAPLKGRVEHIAILKG